jgi:hypothetical protein
MVRKYDSDEERREARRQALYRYNHSEKGRAAQARREAGPLAAARYARYRETEKYAAAQQRFKDSGGRNRLATAHRQNIRVERPELIEAWKAVQLAIRSGQLTRPDGCASCGRTMHLVAHHHLGYAPEHWLDVQWLCRKCHKVEH